MIFGSDASTFAPKCRQTTASRNNEVVATAVTAGYRRLDEVSQKLLTRDQDAFGFPHFEGYSADPDGVKDHGFLSGEGSVCFLHSEVLGPPRSPEPLGRDPFGLNRSHSKSVVRALRPREAILCPPAGR